MTINVALAGAGAFGIKHLDGIRNIPDVKVVSLVGREHGREVRIFCAHDPVELQRIGA